MTEITFTNIDGIKFYSTPTSCISNFENKPWYEKVISTIFSFGTLLKYAINKALMVIHGTGKQMDRYTTAPTTDSKKLVVCLHGLNNNSTQFKKIVDEIQKKGPLQPGIYIPRIIEKGNAKLDTIVAPILENIAAWAKVGQQKELVLIGVSNGGRIARAIEAALINSGQAGKIRHLKFVSIVGACKGSSLVNLVKKFHLSWILSKNIAKEMATDSDRFKQLDADYEQAKKTIGLSRDYVFIASPHDWQVPNYDSTLMEIPDAKVRYSIIPNHGHNSIVNSVAKSVATISMETNV